MPVERLLEMVIQNNKKGDTVTIESSGPDENEALAAVCEFIDNLPALYPNEESLDKRMIIIHNRKGIIERALQEKSPSPITAGKKVLVALYQYPDHCEALNYSNSKLLKRLSEHYTVTRIPLLDYNAVHLAQKEPFDALITHFPEGKYSSKDLLDRSDIYKSGINLIRLIWETNLIWSL